MENTKYYQWTSILEKAYDQNVLHELINELSNDPELTKENRYFAYCRLDRYLFLHPEACNRETRMLLDVLYQKIYDEYKAELNIPDETAYIPEKKRDNSFVAVIISQVLSVEHGPTKTLLDRCYVLEKVLKKHVLIINTAEVMTPYGYMDWCSPAVGNYITDYQEKEYLEYKGFKFPYFQCPQEMPQTEIISMVRNVLIKKAPYFILFIGSGSITADMCADIAPALAVGLVPSERVQTRGAFQMIGRKINDEDMEWLSRHGYDKDHIIEGLFTSAFKPQTHHYLRESMYLPEDVTVCLVVGGRLDDEIGDDFIAMIRRLAEKNIYTVFAGVFNSYLQYTEHDPLLNEKTVYIGFQEDMLAVCECCDIYLNPKRRGGGTSAAEALFKGLPVLTEEYGDVAVGAGEEFIVKDLDDMYEKVLRMSEDKSYYDEMHDKAIARAQKLTDSEGEFVRVIREMISRKNF